MRLVVKGAGDLASGVALRLHRAGITPIMTEIEHPTTIRRTVSFSSAVFGGETMVEDARAVRAGSLDEALALCEQGIIPVLVDETAQVVAQWKPDAVVDAILAKRNINTRACDAPMVIALGPGFIAPKDCHAIIETMRGHDLGRVIYEGQALPNTGVPGLLYGRSRERVLHSPAEGIFHAVKQIGDMVQEGDVLAVVAGEKIRSEISGVLRGILTDGMYVHKGLKVGDVDPGGERAHCYTVSDKARALGGAVLEALLHLAKREGIGI